jgi:LPS export ABC transporter protein LptC
MTSLARIATVAAGVCAVALSACRNSKAPPVAAKATAADSADQILVRATFLLSTAGIQRGRLDADTAYVLDQESRFDLRRTHVAFTTETGAPQGTMEANRGIYDLRTHILDGTGDVVVKLVDGKMLKSPHVVYNEISHQISSDTSFTVAGPTGTQYGIGFTSNESFSKFNCLRACGANFSVQLPEK